MSNKRRRLKMKEFGGIHTICATVRVILIFKATFTDWVRFPEVARSRNLCLVSLPLRAPDGFGMHGSCMGKPRISVLSYPCWHGFSNLSGSATKGGTQRDWKFNLSNLQFCRIKEEIPTWFCMEERFVDIGFGVLIVLKVNRSPASLLDKNRIFHPGAQQKLSPPLRAL